MLITAKNPANWKSLQDYAAQILNECGFNAETEKQVSDLRSIIELDVYAEENINGRKYSIICECKHWKAPIPQTIVHAFRSVVSDLGANIGYIISKAGFKKGAQLSSTLTNIKLVTWQQFQELFFDSWYQNYFVPTITTELDDVLTYSEPVDVKWQRTIDKMSEEDTKEFLELKDKYDVFGHLIMNYTTYSQFLKNEKKISLLPSALGHLHSETDKKYLMERIPKEILEEQGYREFLDKSILFGKQITSAYKKFQDKYGYEL